MENYLDNIDLYEVDKQDYRSYEYRCKDRQTMKVRPREGVSVFKDIKTGEWLYGYEEENIMCMPARRFFIFYSTNVAKTANYRPINLSRFLLK